MNWIKLNILAISAVSWDDGSDFLSGNFLKWQGGVAFVMNKIIGHRFEYYKQWNNRLY